MPNKRPRGLRVEVAVGDGGRQVEPSAHQSADVLSAAHAAGGVAGGNGAFVVVARQSADPFRAGDAAGGVGRQDLAVGHVAHQTADVVAAAHDADGGVA